METEALISIGLVLLMLIATFFVFVLTMKRHKHNADYYSLFVIGLAWFVVGIPIENYLLSLIGVIFFAIGLANKDKWKANRRQWHRMTSHERKLVVMTIILLAVLIGLGVLIHILFRS